jgi:plasmid stabilization system protein ParE
MYSLAISDEARLDILDAFLWYEEQQQGLGLKFESYLEAGFNLIQNSPLLFEKKYDDIRIHYLDKFPYGIHYIMNEESVHVLAVFHTSKDPQNWFERI